MPELTPDNLEQVVAACSQNLEMISLGLNQCFERQWQMTVGEPATCDASASAWEGAGLVATVSVGESLLLFALSAALPLPEWHRKPTPSQAARMHCLGMEWAVACLPDDLPGEIVHVQAVGNIADFIAGCEPLEGAAFLPLLTAADGEEPAPRIWLIWPVARVPAPPTAESAPDKDREQAAQSAAGDSGSAPSAKPQTAAPTPSPERAADEPANAPESPGPDVPRAPHPVGRILNLSVRIIVTLAEKRIELGQILGLGPGSIVTFDKPCEELLDLYVNNRVYCRGEAVKIGEKFGLKICEMGSRSKRVSAVVNTSE